MKRKSRKEVWKDILRHKGLYKISNRGRVKSFWFGRERILTPYPLRDDYLAVKLVDRNGIKKHWMVHRLVALHFKKNTKRLPQINHKNAKKHDNRASNLEWCTLQYNIKHSRKLGLQGPPPNRLFDDKTVKLIRKQLKRGVTAIEIANSYKVGKGIIFNIKNNKTYKTINI